MVTPINPHLARFTADFADLWTKFCEDAPDEFFDLFNPVSVQLHTGDGLTAEFYEEGIAFYPEKKGNAVG